MERLKNLTILYVEDEDTIRRLTSKMLEKRVKEIVSVEDGVEALKVFDDLAPDVVITDLEMPNMGGEELISKIEKKNKDVKTIIVSGDDDFVDGEADFVMVKPVNKKLLFDKLLEFA